MSELSDAMREINERSPHFSGAGAKDQGMNAAIRAQRKEISKLSDGEVERLANMDTEGWSYEARKELFGHLTSFDHANKTAEALSLLAKEEAKARYDALIPALISADKLKKVLSR